MPVSNTPEYNQVEKVQELGAETQDIRELIQENITEPKYEVFKGNSEAARVLQEYLRYSREENPKSKLGLTRDNPNLNRLAKEMDRGLNRIAEKKQAELEIKRQIIDLRDAVNSKASTLDSKTLTLDDEAAKGVTAINTVRTSVSLGAISESSTINTIATNTDIQSILNDIKPEAKLNSEAIGKNISASKTLIETLSTDYAIEEANLQAIATSRVLLTSDQQGSVDKYVSYLQQKREKITNYIEFLKQAKIYFSVLQVSPAYDQKQDLLKRTEETVQSREENIKQKNDFEASVYAAQADMLTRRIRTTEDASVGILQERIEKNSGSEQARIAMDIYLLVQKELNNKSKLPLDAETRGYVLLMAMIKGADWVLKPENIPGLNEKGMGFVLFEKQKAYQLGSLLRNDTFGSKAEFLDEKGLPKQELLDAFRLRISEKKVTVEYDTLSTDLKKVADAYKNFYLDKIEKQSGAESLKAKEINGLLAGLKEKAVNFSSVLEGHKKINTTFDASGYTSFLEKLNAVPALPEVMPVIGWYSEKEKQSVTKGNSDIQTLLTTLTGALNYPANFKKLEDDPIYKALNGTQIEGMKALIDKLSGGDNASADQILADIQNNFVGKRNEIALATMSQNSGMSPETLTVLAENTRLLEIQQLSDFEKLARDADITYENAFKLYFQKNYWSNPELMANRWEEDLRKNLVAGTGKESAAYRVLKEVMSSTPGNIAFQEALIDAKNPAHEKSMQMMQAIVKEFNSLTERFKEDQTAMQRYVEGVYGEKNTVHHYLNEAVHKTVDLISNGSPAERVIAIYLLYQFFSKGVFGKEGWPSKLTKGAMLGLGGAILYERFSGKAALAFLGDNPDNLARGSSLQEQANNMGIEFNEKAKYKALDLLQKKKIEDILKWYDNRGQFGLDANGYSETKALTGSGLLTAGEIAAIDPTENNPEMNAKAFVEVFEKSLKYLGRKITRESVSDENELIKIARDTLVAQFTQKGLQETVKKGNVLYLSPAEAGNITNISFTWKEVAQVFATSNAYEKANREREILGGIPSAIYAKWIEYKQKGLPKWLVLKEKTGDITDEWIKKFTEQYGPEALDTMEEWGQKGWAFTVEKGQELKAFWKESPEAIRIKRTAANTWEVITTGIKIPAIATLSVSEKATSRFSDLIRNVDARLRAWENNEIPITANILNGNLTERNEALDLYAVSHGPRLFGKYESDWLEEDAGVGLGMLRANADIMINPDHRIDFKVAKGYVNILGLASNIKTNTAEAREQAYRDGIENLKNYLKRPENLKHLDQNDEFTKAIISGDNDQIREFVEPYVDRYGSMYNNINGYMLFLRVPVPLNESYRTVTKTTINGKEVQVRQNYEYIERKTDRWKFGNLDKYKKTIVFSTEDEILGEYIDDIRNDDVWSKRFMQEFLLFEAYNPGLIDVEKLLNQAQAAIDGMAITDFNEGDNKKAKFFELLKDRYRDRFMEEQHWSASANQMEGELKQALGASAASDFIKYHSTITEKVTYGSFVQKGKEYLVADAVGKQYRMYLAEELVKAYHNNKTLIADGSFGGFNSGKPVPQAKWVEYLTTKFIEKESITLPEAVISSALVGGKELLDGIFKTLHAKIIGETKEKKK